MAGYNEILVGRFNRLLQRMLSIKGNAPVSTIAPDWMGVLAHDLERAELMYLAGWQRFGISFFPGANGAGNFNGLQIFNQKPASGTAVIAVIELIEFFATTNGQQFNIAIQDPRNGPIGLFSGGGAVGSTSSGFDGRGPQTPYCTVASRANNQVGLGTVIRQVPMQQSGAAGTGPGYYSAIIHLDMEIQLSPGMALHIFNTIANQGGPFVNVQWRERAIEDSETVITV